MGGLGGGKIKTIPPFLTDASQISDGVIVASKITVNELSAISANLGTITAGTITGVILQTGTSGKRIVLDGTQDTFTVYDAGGTDVLDIYGVGSNVIMRILPNSNNSALFVQNNSASILNSNLVEITMQNASSTGDALLITHYGQGTALVVVNAYSASNPTGAFTQNVATLSHFFKQSVYNGGASSSITIWQSDGTSPANSLTGNAGDLCIGGPNNTIWYCLGSQVWTTLGRVDYGDGSDGSVTITGSVTLTRDMFYQSLTVAAGADFYPNGFKVYCQTPIYFEGFVANNGGDGGTGGTPGTNSGTGGAAGAAGAAAAGGSLPGGIAGAPGGQGGNGNGGNGQVGGNGNSQSKSAISTSPATGGAGGNGQGGGGVYGGYGANPGTPGSTTKTGQYSSIWEAILIRLTTGGSGSGGGGAGGGVNNTSGGVLTGGGGGGGSGAPGGILWFCAPAIIVTSTGQVHANGGKGGDGGNGGSLTLPPPSNSGSGGGGGGGAGGDGGIILFITPYYYSVGQVQVLHGNGGTYGVGGNYGGQQGVAGNPGNDGLIIHLVP